MKSLLQKYKGVIRFVVFFLGSYLVLSLLYAGYLSVSQGSDSQPDYITQLVATQSSAVISGFNYQATLTPMGNIPSLMLYVEGKPLARIIEGCNAISIIILFMAFVIAFSQNLKKTVFFLFAGAVLLYGVNIIRIAILSILLYEYPQHIDMLHGVVFPGIIYGMVFLLWMVWVRMLKPIKHK